jgi:hypothetical protein
MNGTFQTTMDNWGAKEARTADALFDSACEGLQSLQVKLLAEGELERVVNAALNGFFQGIHQSTPTYSHWRPALVVPGSAAVSGLRE